jgi:hypothetical protein
MPLPLRSKRCSPRTLASAAALAFVATCAGTTLPARAAATPAPLPSLRHLVFNFDVGVTNVTNRRIEGNLASGATSEVEAGKTMTSSAGQTRKGQIVVDVVAATADAGLVVDITQNSPDKAEPLTRVAIASDGTLLYDPKLELSQEEIALLHLLARNVVGGTVHAKGDTWDIPESSANYKGSTTYKVTDVAPPTVELIDVEGSFKATGLHPADGVTHGKVTFDPSLVVPDSANLTSHIVATTSPGVMVTTDLTIQLTLAEDSFAKKKTS